MGIYSHKRCTGLLGIFLGISFVTAAAGQAPAPPVPTVWDKLGMTQAFKNLQNSLVNPNGNHPGLESKPPLKSIADPANLDPQQPKVIQAAAKIKQQEDLAPQKIKAIKYLATIGCEGCYDQKVGVRAPLLDALGDCTEEVRYEAAKALAKVAGDPCARCKGTCCNAEVMNKLQDKASGKDEKGCFKEPSERVRKASQSALDACKKKLPPGPEAPTVTPVIPGETPTPIKPKGEGPTIIREAPTPIPPAPGPFPQPTPAPPADKPAETPAEPRTTSALQSSAQPAPMTSTLTMNVRPIAYEQKNATPAAATVTRLKKVDSSGSTIVIRIVEPSSK